MARIAAGRLIAAGRVGLLPAAFNPPTVAHVALAEAARERFELDQVVYALPETLPHKQVVRPGVDERLRWLEPLVDGRTEVAAAVCRGGLVVDIVREFEAVLEAPSEIFVIAGRDAAERYRDWDYGTGESFTAQLQRYRLLVASRDGLYDVDPEHEGRIERFSIDSRFAAASSSKVREAIRAGAPWRHMVCLGIQEAVAAAYEEGVG